MPPHERHDGQMENQVNSAVEKERGEGSAAYLPLRVVLVEDSEVLRDILVGLVPSVAKVDFVGFAAGQSEAEQVLQDKRPDLAIIDLELAQGNGMSLLQTISMAPDLYGKPSMVVFSNHAHLGIQDRCLALGALAFYDKAFQMDELLEFVRNCAPGNS